MSKGSVHRRSGAGISLLFLDEQQDPGARKLALLVALVLHLVLLTVTLPSTIRRPPRQAQASAPIRIISLPPPQPKSVVRPKTVERQALEPSRLPIPVPEFDSVQAFDGASEAAAGPELQPSVDVVVGEPSAPPTSSPLRPHIDEGVVYPSLLESTRVLPEYPERAREMRVTGSVILEAVIRKDGTVGDLRVLRGPDPRLGFQEAAIEAVRRWRYRPGTQHGRPVDVLFTIVVDFVLE